MSLKALAKYLVFLNSLLALSQIGKRYISMPADGKNLLSTARTSIGNRLTRWQREWWRLRHGIANRHSPNRTKVIL